VIHKPENLKSHIKISMTVCSCAAKMVCAVEGLEVGMSRTVIVAARCFSIVALVSSAIALIPQFVAAQIAPDNTLGAERSIVTPNLIINGETGDRIDGGARRGANLFHSFQEFNINEGQRVYFNNPAGVENILSRVTGNGVSDIQGTLGVIGNANLFLLNPNGIIFGSNARLDVNGSFTATTADAIQFDNQGFFSAVNPEVPTLLTVNPSAFWFNQLQRGDITNRSLAPAELNPIGQAAFGLRVGDGSTLTLLGGNVSLDRGRLNAFGGRVEIGAVAGLGAIALSPDSSLSFPSSVERSDVALTNGAAINTAAGGGGGIAINARNINLSGGSTLTTGILSGLGGEGVRSGDIRLDATDSIEVIEASRIATRIFGQGRAGSTVINANNRILIEGANRGTRTPVIRNSLEQGAIGAGGEIHLSANSIEVNRTGISVNSLGQGNAGNIIVRASGKLSLDESIISAIIIGSGQSGDIQLFADSLSSRGTQIGSAVVGRGNAGNVIIRVNKDFSFRGTGVLFSRDEASGLETRRVFSAIYGLVEQGGVGQGGNIDISAESISFSHGGALDSGLRGRGRAGDITLHARERFLLDEGYIGSAVESTAVGNAGSIQISARILSIRNGSALTSDTLGRGRAGNIIVRAHDSLLLEGVGARGFSSTISTGTFSSATGQGGNITIDTSRFRIMNGATINARTDNSNRGGDITIRADVFTAVNGGQLITTARGNGNAGNITLNIANRAIFAGNDPTFERRFARFGSNVLNENRGESGLFASTLPNSTSNGGNIIISASSLEIQDGASITVDSRGRGQGGDVDIRTGSLGISNQARLSAGTASSNGGNINLQIDDVMLLRHRSNITTEAGTERAGGNGGNIRINAPFVVAVPSEDSNINANAFQGNGGNINIASQGLLGLQVSDRPTLLSDITASSEFGITGTVIITRPDVDPSQGVIEFPTEVVDASNQISQICANEASGTSSEFVITGRGGLPPAPTQLVSADAVVVRLAELDEAASQHQTSVSQAQPVMQPRMIENISSNPDIMEAQGWIVSDAGSIALVAQAPIVTPNSSAVSSATCADS
jgi:filamentous hemagglutinin family protein